MLTLTIEERNTKERPAALRAAGKVPAVLYGRKEPSTPVVVDAKEFGRVLKAAGESAVLTLAGAGEPKEALVHEIARDPVSGAVEHVDFYVTEKGVKVAVKVPLAFEGEAPAVKKLGGTVVKVLHELEVEALPRDLPQEILVDVSALENFDDKIMVKDIAAPAGVTFLADPEETIAAVSQPQEEPEEPVGAIDMESIEVEQKGKKEEGDEDAVEGEEKKE